MRFGFIGSGQVAQTIASQLLEHGHEATFSGRRDAAGTADKISHLGTGATAVSLQEAAAAEIVVLTVPWQGVESVLKGLPAWNGRILIDTTNPFIATGPSKYSRADLGGRSSSVIIAEQAPGARVVKAFNSILMTNLEKGPRQGDGRRVLFVSGDDQPAKTKVRDLIEDLGFAVVDLGNLEDGGRMQQGGGPLAGKDLLMLSDWSLKT